MSKLFGLEHALRSACDGLEDERQRYGNGHPVTVRGRSLFGAPLVAHARFLAENVWQLDGDDSLEHIERNATDYATLLRLSPQSLQLAANVRQELEAPAGEGEVYVLTQVTAWPPC